MTSKRRSFNFLSRLLVNSNARHRNALGTTTCPRKKTATATLLSSPHSAGQTYLTLNDIPGPKPSIPFIGTAWQYFPGGRYNIWNMHEACIDKYLRYGPIMKEEFEWRKPVVHLFNPEDFEIINKVQGKHPIRPVSEFLKYYRQKNPDKYDSVGLANTVGEEWNNIRKNLNPVMNQVIHFDYMVNDMNNICDDFVDLLKKKRNSETFCIDELQGLVYRLALEAIYQMSLDSRLGCLEENLHPESPASSMIYSVKLLFEAFQDLYYGLPLWKLYPTAAYKKLDKAESIMYAAASNRVEEVMEALKKKGNLKNSKGVLQALLKAEGITDKEVKVTIIDFLSGGIFTVTNAFCFLLYHISNNPEAQEKLYKEVMDLMPDGVFRTNMVSKMRYLKACIKESFRLTPTIPTITRILTDDIVIAGYHIPPGVPFFCNYTVPCMQAKYYPEPERFKPERWFKPPESPAVLLPFGFGPRMCIGRRFSEFEMYSTLAKVIYHFKLESTRQEVRCKQNFIIVPSHPVSVILKDRKKC